MRNDAVRNIQVARKLIERYESITLEEIKSVWELYPSKQPVYDLTLVVARALTGFGGLVGCPLCVAARDGEYSPDDTELYCFRHCIYGDDGNCHKGAMAASYFTIRNAITPAGLLQAYRNRAVAIRGRLKE